MERIDIKLVSTEINPADAIKFVTDEGSGGLNVFIGNVRNHTKGETVLKLEFEAYKPMALKEMHKIALQALDQFEVNKISIQHRIGTLFSQFS